MLIIRYYYIDTSPTYAPVWILHHTQTDPFYFLLTLALLASTTFRNELLQQEENQTVFSIANYIH